MVFLDVLNRLFGPRSENRELAQALHVLTQHFVDEGSKRGVTALKDFAQISQEFILDSLGGVSSLPKTGRVIDIGTGGGVPGLVLAMARPDLEFVLTDSSSKKTQWVIETVGLLGLKNVEVVTRRLELLGQDPEFRETFDCVTAKALAALNVLSEFALPLLKVGGTLLAYKGPALPQEIEEARFALTELSAEVRRCSGYSIGEKHFMLCQIVKTAPTPQRYPRRDGVPQKKPLSNSRKN